jgi:hypothetical protein
VLENEGNLILSSTRDMVAPFEDLVQPSWGDHDLEWDPTIIHSLQFQVLSAEQGTMTYGFCVSDIRFLDRQGNLIDVPPPGTDR